MNKNQKNNSTRTNKHQANSNKKIKLKKNIFKKIKWKNIILFLLLLIFLIIFIFSVINIVKWKLDSNKTDKQIESAQKDIKINEHGDSEKTEIIENNVTKSDPYWDYIKMKLINVDFSDLKRTNDSTVGWIQVKGTNINYPFVQHSDNNFYLNHTFDKTYNKAGWVFMDYRNNVSDFNKNTILYAHGRIDNTMFGSLRKILTSGWLNNKNNYIVKLSTAYENTLWQVFSVYRIPTTNDYLKISFENDIKFFKFATMLLKRSAYDFNTTISKNDKILTLSTCYDNNNKVVLHAKLIKREKR